ncbi:zinc finger protein 511 isoform X1 [Piliocolobus tephrosceles]|uniref:zinc finger protein 511 isoform X1 n=1 Tax=Piliocolobus tephrosceles TaxID=591936 RepID=UPI000C2AAC15|nr:zinc finger protein 511 isoform X1 [Piliocolobus tephrosceles]
MQLPPALCARLAAGPGAAEPLPVERDPAAGAAPFRFVARPVRFPREHEFFEDGDVQRHLYLQEVLMQVADAPEKPRVPAFACQVAGCCQVFDALDDYEHHYHALHGNVCSFCKRAFPSGHLLDAHILEWHDALFQILSERQDMVGEVCIAAEAIPSGDGLRVLPQLSGARGQGQGYLSTLGSPVRGAWWWGRARGQREVMPSPCQYQCLVEGCTEKFKTSRDRKDHMVRMHLYPADFRFDKPKKSRSPASAEVPGDSGERSEGEAMEICSEPVAASPAPAGERRTYSHRIPSTICFGQGAARGFKSNKKKTKQC